MIVFGLSRIVGDPRYLYAQEGYGLSPEAWEDLGKQLGLDKPLIVQYFVWLGQVARGDLGDSLIGRHPVAKLISQRIFNTMQLGLASWLLGTIIGIPLGVLSAIKRGSILDLIGRGFAAMGQAAPPFWVGLMGIFFFSVKMGWLPTGTMGEGPSISNIKYFIMPAVVLGWQPAAGYLRLTRSAMLEVLDAEFIKFARSKGVRNWVVIWKHAFKNALIPPLTLWALMMAQMITGAVVVETVFTWPGMGKLAVDAVMQNDFPTMTGVVLIFACVYIFLNLVADIAYAFIDPRIRYT
jgi:peptide/nickel transport system permease protein